MTPTHHTVLITGGATGIGFALAKKFHSAGNRVILVGRREEALRQAAGQLSGCLIAVADVSQETDRERLVRDFPDVSILVNNAGVESVGTFLSLNENEIDRVLGINIKGVIFGTQAAAEQMKKQQGVGKIINACSIAGHESYEMLSLYCATKHAVRSFTHSTAKELAPYNIRVNAYCPGVADTPMWERIDAAFVEHKGYQPKQAWNEFTKGILAGRPQQPEDVANLVSFLASEDADYITGQTILTDGGMVFR